MESRSFGPPAGPPLWDPPSDSTRAGPRPPVGPAHRRRASTWGLTLSLALSLSVGAVGGFLGGHLSGTRAAEQAVTSAAPTVGDTDINPSVPSDHPPGAIDVASIVTEAQPSVVEITTVIETQTNSWVSSGRGVGTGIVLDADGHVLTNAHVLEGATDIRITVPGDSEPRPAVIVGSDPALDLAVLRLGDPAGIQPARIGSSAGVVVGEPVVAIGNALGLAGGPTVSQGIISATGRSVTTVNGTLTGLLQTDTAISSGNSGGPLLDAQGRVIGINTAVAGSTAGIVATNVGFAIPIDLAMATTGRLIHGT